MIKVKFNKEISLYILFGMFTSLISLGSFIILDFLLGANYYLISNILSFLMATTFAFITNKLVVFKSRDWKIYTVLKEALSFLLARVFNFLFIEQLGIFIAVEVFRANEMEVYGISGRIVAKLILAFIAVVFNYLFSKLLVFRSKQSEE